MREPTGKLHSLGKFWRIRIGARKHGISNDAGLTSLAAALIVHCHCQREPQPVPDLCASFPMKLSLPDGRTIDAAEALRAFTSFPRRCSECGSHQRRDHEHEKHECDEPEPEQPMRHRFDRISGQIVPYDNGESLED
jgi:hypothetical protein